MLNSHKSDTKAAKKFKVTKLQYKNTNWSKKFKCSKNLKVGYLQGKYKRSENTNPKRGPIIKCPTQKLKKWGIPLN